MTGGVIPRFVMTQAGNVGIGNPSPGQKLEVAGNLRISGPGNALIFPDGSVLSSAATGVGGGTITGITTSSGSGLSGGANSGNVTLALDTAFTDSRYVKAGADNTFTGANTLQGETTIGGGGIAKDGAGLKHVRRVFGGISPGAFGTGTFSWDTPFADTNYTVTCTFLDTVDGAGLRLHRIKSTTTTSVTVVFSNDDLVTPF